MCYTVVASSETIAGEEGIETANDIITGKAIFVTGISNNNYIKLRSVNFKKGEK